MKPALGLQKCPFTFFCILLLVFQSLETLTVSREVLYTLAEKMAPVCSALFSVTVSLGARARTSKRALRPVTVREGPVGLGEAGNWPCCFSVTVFISVFDEGGKDQTFERAAGPDLFCQRTALLSQPCLRQRPVGALFPAQQRAVALARGS